MKTVCLTIKRCLVLAPAVLLLISGWPTGCVQALAEGYNLVEPSLNPPVCDRLLIFIT